MLVSLFMFFFSSSSFFILVLLHELFFQEYKSGFSDSKHKETRLIHEKILFV